MDFEELILRFFALVEGLGSYKPPLRQFLNEFMRKNRNSTLNQHSVDLFRECCVAVHDVLGAAPFRAGGSKNPVNKAMFDAIMVPVAFAERDQMRTRAGEVREAVAAVVEDEDFAKAIGRATADRQRMLYRIGLVADRLRKAGVPVGLDEGLGLNNPALGS